MATPTDTRPQSVGDRDAHFHRVLGFGDATALVAGSMIGSGIFIVPAVMTRELGAPGWMLAVWMLAGVMTVLAASLYGNLVARFPRAGGQYVYLREAFGPVVGFLYGWTLFLVIQTGTIAAVAVAFARFAGVLVPAIHDSSLVAMQSAGPAAEPAAGLLYSVATAVTPERVLAIALIALLTAANCRGIELGKTIQNGFTGAKIAALLALIVLCSTLGREPAIAAANFSDAWTRTGTHLPLAAAVGSAIVGALFSMDAWNNVTFAAEEVRAPERTIPRAMVTGTVLVVALYLAANVAYLLVLPAHGAPDGATPLERGIAYAGGDRVGTAVMEVVLGPAGVVAMAVAIMVSTFGCVNGLVLSGARVFYAMARDSLFFAPAARLSWRGAPATALVLQGVWASFLTLTGTYGDLLDYVIFAALLFYALTVGATLRARFSAGASRNALAVVYIVAAGAVMLDLLVVKPRFTWPGLLIVASGLPVYWLWARGRTPPPSVPA